MSSSIHNLLKDLTNKNNIPQSIRSLLKISLRLIVESKKIKNIVVAILKTAEDGILIIKCSSVPIYFRVHRWV